MSALPKQVEQDLRDLEAYETQLNAEKNPAPAQQPDPNVASAPAPAEVPPTGEQAPVSPTPAVAAQPDTPNWEQKYRTLQGMFDAEVPKLHHQTKAQAAQIATMQAQIEALQKPAAKVEPPAPLVTDQDVEQYGENFIDVQRRIAQEVVRDVVTPLQADLKARDAEIAQLKQALTQTDGNVVALTFEQRLAQAVPDFAQVNVDPKWIAFLDEIDPFTREPRRSYAEFVYKQGDVERLKQVVDFFKSTHGTPVVDPAEAERKQRKLELERQITPTRANSQPTTTPTPNTRIYTEKDMEAGFAVVRKLNTAGKLDEAAKLEAELSLAYMENRVRG